MKKLEELGKVVTSDILIIGGGMAGLTSACLIKERRPELDVLIVESATTGYAGQSIMAGHGMFCVFPDQSVDSYCEWATRVGGQYLNDQELLREYGEKSYDSLKLMDRLGAVVSKDKDGNIGGTKVSAGNFGMGNVDNDMALHLKKRADALGVRVIDKTQVFDLLKDGDHIAGAIGLCRLDGTFYIFNAKAVALATGGCHYNVSGLFHGNGEAVAAAYNIGAEMRNAEFFTQCDIIIRDRGEKIYGVVKNLFNKDGVNISKKYAPDADEITYPLVFGMKKEIEEGRGPLYIDLSIHDEIMDTVGAGATEFPDGSPRFLPSFVKWADHLDKKFENVASKKELKPEVSLTLTMTTCPVSVDHQMRTTVPGLWAIGAVSFWGQAYMGWIHGDGVGNAVKSSMHGAPSIAEYAATRKLGKINVDEVAALKEKRFAPINRKDGELPKFYFDRIGEIVTSFDYCISKTEASLKEALAKIDEVRAELPNLIATDWHELGRCREVESLLTCAQIAFRASLERKESRGLVWRHNRMDYPETDNKNWLKWVVLKKGKDGEMTVRFDPVPIWTYKYKPEDC